MLMFMCVFVIAKILFNHPVNAEERAGISRFYGGAHFMIVPENSLVQGEPMGRYGINRLECSKPHKIMVQ